MNPVFRFCEALFIWCAQQEIPIALARPKYTPEEFINSDLDIIIAKRNISVVINSLRESSLIITCLYQRSDGVTCHIFDPENQIFFHVDLIDRLQIKGIDYLFVNETLNRAVKTGNIFYPDIMDQFIILIMVHGLKHQTANLLQRYNHYLSTVIKEYPVASLQKLQNILGNKRGTIVYEAILANRSITITYGDFLSAAWKTHGIAAITNYFFYHAKELHRRFTMPVYRIAFLGVDGSGKSTLISAVKNKLKDAVPLIKHTRFIPAYPWRKEKDSNQVLAEPHQHENRHYLSSVLKLAYYFFRYWLILFWPRKVPLLYLHDRYITDMYVDPRRYRYNGPALLSLLRFYPRPETYILIDISVESAWQRKQEVSQSELHRQTKQYRQLQSSLPDFHVINGDNNLTDNIARTQNIILQSLKDQNK